MPEVSTTSTAWIDVANATINSKIGINAFENIQIKFNALIRTSNNSYPTYIRFRIGSYYSNQGNTDHKSYIPCEFYLDFKGNFPITIYMQLLITSSLGTAYGKKDDPRAIFSSLEVL